MERALARYLPQTDIFHFYFGQTLVPKTFQFPILKATRRKCVMHFLGDDIRGKTPDELAYGKRADRQIVGSYAATRWVPEAVVVPPGPSTSPSTRRSTRRARAAPRRPRSLRPREEGVRGFVIEACEQLPVDLDVVHGVPHEEAVERFKRADIVVDQMHYIWHGVFAIESMAYGKPVVTSLDETAVRQTEEAFGVRSCRSSRRSRTRSSRSSARSPSPSRSGVGRGEAGRAYVEQVHDIDKLADRLIAVYESL